MTRTVYAAMALIMAIAVVPAAGETPSPRAAAETAASPAAEPAAVRTERLLMVCFLLIS